MIKPQLYGWSPSMNRWHDQTGILHALVERDNVLYPACGVRSNNTFGGVYGTLDEAEKHAGGRACRRCERIAK